MNDRVNQAHPFVKSIGGKTQLLPQILALAPQRINTYYEPFLGGGAVFWALANAGRIDRAVLNDANPLLMATYRGVRNHVAQVIDCLGRYQTQYSIAVHADKGQALYLSVRDAQPAPTPSKDVETAAWYIFINKTCFNGLWRVNREGRFNVGWGKSVSPPILDTENLRLCSQLLKCATLASGDYRALTLKPGLGDFVYCDPPYAPGLSGKAGFTGFTSDKFTLDNQVELAQQADLWRKRGAAVMLSNHATPDVLGMFAVQSPPWRLARVPARRSVNSDGAGRGVVEELLIQYP